MTSPSSHWKSPHQIQHCVEVRRPNNKSHLPKESKVLLLKDAVQIGVNPIHDQLVRMPQEVRQAREDLHDHSSEGVQLRRINMLVVKCVVDMGFQLDWTSNRVLQAEAHTQVLIRPKSFGHQSWKPSTRRLEASRNPYRGRTNCRSPRWFEIALAKQLLNRDIVRVDAKAIQVGRGRDKLGLTRLGKGASKNPLIGKRRPIRGGNRRPRLAAWPSTPQSQVGFCALTVPTEQLDGLEVGCYPRWLLPRGAKPTDVNVRFALAILGHKCEHWWVNPHQ